MKNYIYLLKRAKVILFYDNLTYDNKNELNIYN